MASTSLPSCGRRLGESALTVVCGFSCVWVGGCRDSGPVVVCVEVVASGSLAERSFMGRSCCSNGLGRNLVSLVRRGWRLGRRVSEDAVDFLAGAAARMLVRRLWSASDIPCAA